MNGWTITRVWRIDHKLVVAKTIEEAIEVFKSYMGKDYQDEPHDIAGISTGTFPTDYNALIKEETE